MTHGKDRRKYTRFRSLNIIRFLDRSGGALKSNPTLVNMSEGGLCFYCDDPLSLKDTINLTINISEFNCMVKTFAIVVWVQRSTEHVGTHFTGVEFVGLEESNRDIIRRLAKSKRVKA